MQAVGEDGHSVGVGVRPLPKNMDRSSSSSGDDGGSRSDGGRLAKDAAAAAAVRC